MILSKQPSKLNPIFKHDQCFTIMIASLFLTYLLTRNVLNGYLEFLLTGSRGGEVHNVWFPFKRIIL